MEPMTSHYADVSWEIMDIMNNIEVWLVCGDRGGTVVKMLCYKS